MGDHYKNMLKFFKHSSIYDSNDHSLAERPSHNMNEIICGY